MSMCAHRREASVACNVSVTAFGLYGPMSSFSFVVINVYVCLYVHAGGAGCQAEGGQYPSRFGEDQGGPS